MQAENSASEIHIQDPMAEKRNSNDIKECQSKIEKSPGIVSSEVGNIAKNYRIIFCKTFCCFQERKVDFKIFEREAPFRYMKLT